MWLRRQNTSQPHMRMCLGANKDKARKQEDLHKTSRQMASQIRAMIPTRKIRKRRRVKIKREMPREMTKATGREDRTIRTVAGLARDRAKEAKKGRTEKIGKAG